MLCMGDLKGLLQTLAFGLGFGGAVLNLLLAIVTAKRKHQDVDWLLILLGALLDLACCLYLGYRVLLLWITRGALAEICDFGSAGVAAGMLAGLVLTSTLALVRYLAIVRDVRGRKAVVYPAALGLCGLVFGAYMVHGLTSPSIPIPSKIYCLPRYWGEGISVLFGFFNVAVYVSSLSLVFFCYSAISLHYYLTLKRHGQRGCQLYTSVIGVFLIVLIYLAATAPQLFVFFYLLGANERTLLIDAISIIPMAGLPVANALYTFLLHDETKHMLVALITCRPYSSSYPDVYPSHLPYHE